MTRKCELALRPLTIALALAAASQAAHGAPTPRTNPPLDSIGHLVVWEDPGSTGSEVAREAANTAPARRDYADPPPPACVPYSGLPCIALRIESPSGNPSPNVRRSTMIID